MVRWDRTPSCSPSDMEKGCVCVFRLYLRDSVQVELQSGQAKDNSLELASQQTRGVGFLCTGSQLPCLGNRTSNATKVLMVALKKR